MLDILKNCFKELPFVHFSAVLSNLSQILQIVGTEYTKDGDAKNAAIDAICEILQSEKDVVYTKTEVTNNIS